MKIEVLDHGYVQFIEAWGCGLYGVLTEQPGGHVDVERDMEAGIIEAARQSTQGSFRGWDTDAKLLRHLFRNRPRHTGPFEFAGMVIEVQAPIFVFREWHRHRTQSYAEMSARYGPVPDFQYTPTFDRLMQVNNPTRNKQAGNIGGIELTADNAMKWLAMLEHAYAVAQEAYRFGLAVGVAKELARCPMLVGNYSRMRASVNLHNWLNFMTLRDEAGAQFETREFAKAAGQLLAQTFPHTWELYQELRSDTAKAWELWQAWKDAQGV